MFTGIIRSFGIVKDLVTTDAGAKLCVDSDVFSKSDGDLSPLRIGDSLAVDGVCLTLADIRNSCGDFDLASETLRRTTLGSLKPGQRVNMERSLRFGERIDGHLVQGHVDGVGRILSRENEGQTVKLRISMPREVRPYIVPKGAVCVNGVSLTVGEVDEKGFSVYIIPHTLSATTLSEAQAGARLNVEADCIARYVHQLSLPYRPDASDGRVS